MLTQINRLHAVCSGVTAQFFVLGLERLEPDSGARHALIASGLLMVVVELAAFGLAALLPRAALRALRVQLVLCGALLLAFEGVTIYLTQATLHQGSALIQAAQQARALSLRQSIEQQRAGAAALRQSGVRQAASANAWAQHLGSVTLKEALAAERQIEATSTELATLEAAQRVGMTDVLGAQGAVLYHVARSCLITVMGLVMFGAAGALWRAGRESVAKEAPPCVAPCVTSYQPSTERVVSALPKGWTASVPVLPLALPLMQATIAVAAPVATDVTPDVALVATPVTLVTNDVTPQDEPVADRYTQVRAAVASGAIKPTVRAILEHVGGATLTARRYLMQLETEGVTVRSGRGWEVV